MYIAGEIAAVARRMHAIASGPAIGGPDFDDLVRAAPSSRAVIDRSIGQSAAAAGIDPALIAAIVASESGFDPRATSRAGARGLMQLMPSTAASLGVRDAYDPLQNLRAGARYLRSLLDRFGDVELAVAAYNAGPAAVERFGGVPPYAETREYVRSVMARYRKSAKLRTVADHSALR